MTRLLTQGIKGYYNLIFRNEEKIRKYISKGATSSSAFQAEGYWKGLFELLRDYSQEPIHASKVVPFCATHDINVSDNTRDIARMVNTFF